MSDNISIITRFTYNFVLFLLFYFLLFSNMRQLALSASINSNNDKLGDIHLHMTDDELHSIFGSKEVPEYEVIDVIKQTRHKRSAQKPYDELVSISLRNKQFHLQLTRNSNLMTSPLKFEEINGDGSSQNQYIVEHPQCLYHGNVAENDNSLVAISTCGLRAAEMTGIIHLTNSEPYMLRPIPKRLLKPDQTAHIIYQKENKNHKCGHESQNEKPEIIDNHLEEIDGQAKRTRRRRQTDEKINKTIETAVFVDDALYNKLLIENPDNVNEAVVNIVFTFINAVQLIYSQSSLTNRVNIVLVQVSVIKRASAGPSKRQGNIENYLESFCSWQSRRNPKGDYNASHWDHGLMLTGQVMPPPLLIYAYAYRVDLHMGEPENTVVIGLAWVSGMCRRQFSCSINEGTTFESVFVISHELGHNLGMQHDGEKNKNDCSETDYIMSSSLGPGKTTWSKCSNKYLADFFKSPSSTCLNDKAIARTELDHRSENLPGQLYAASIQCKYSYGGKYKPYITDETPFNNVCRELWCANGTVARRAHPALDGTPCGPQQLCFHGKCMEKLKIRQELKVYDLLPRNPYGKKT